MEDKEGRHAIKIPVAQTVVGPHVQRSGMAEEAIRELGASIEAEGLINPITVVQKDDMFVVAIGHRRFTAVKGLGWEFIDAYVSELPLETLEAQIRAENLHRVDLSPAEIANDLYVLCVEKETPVSQVAKMYKKSEQWVRSHLEITTWPEILVDAVHQGQIAKSAADQLFRVKDADTLEYFLRMAVESGATARVCAAWAGSWEAQLPPEEAVSTPVPEQPKMTQPIRLAMPCLCCKEEYEPDQLAHAYICVHCHGQISNMPPGGI